MARGWDSKSVESQIASAAAPARARIPQPAEEDIELRAKRESLLLSRTRIVRDLEKARHPNYRQVLEAALAHLDRQLKQLG